MQMQQRKVYTKKSKMYQIKSTKTAKIKNKTKQIITQIQKAFIQPHGMESNSSPPKLPPPPPLLVLEALLSSLLLMAVEIYPPHLLALEDPLPPLPLVVEVLLLLLLFPLLLNGNGDGISPIRVQQRTPWPLKL